MRTNSALPAFPIRLAIATVATIATTFVLGLPAVASASQTLTVKKAGSASGTVVSSPAGIECGQTCAAGFADGTAVTLTATPGPISQPAQWTGCASVSAEDKCEVTMSAAKSVTATFNLIKHQLTVTKLGTGTGTVTSKPLGISCDPTCSASFTEGAVVALTGVPAAGGLPVQWSGCDSVDAEGRCVVTMKEAKAVTATFDLPAFELSVTEAGTSAGAVTSSPAGIECGSTCSASFIVGTAVTLTATPGPHAEPVQWSGCGEVDAQRRCHVTMNAAKAVTATFELNPLYVEFTVTVNPKGTGSGSVQSSPAGISCPPDCSEPYVFKTPVTLTATAAAGSEFAHWSGGTCSGSLPCERKINSNRTVNAVFAAVGNRTLTIAKTGDGQGTVISANVAGIDCGQTCSAELDAKTKVTLKATASSGSTFSGWSGEGCSGVEACRVTMNEARNVTAGFAKAPPAPSELLVAGRAKVRAGRALLKLACEGGTPCEGSLRLLIKVRNAGGQTKGLVIGQGTYALAAGARQTLSLKLSSRAKRLLGGVQSLRARVTGTGIDTHAVRLAA